MQTIEVRRWDDLDNAVPAARTVRLVLDGAEVSLDLGEENYQRLRRAVDPFLAAGRRERGSGKPLTDIGAARAENAAMRAWCRRDGRPVGASGYVRKRDQAAYRAFLAAKARGAGQ
jgi:hypothetical protein